MTAPDRKEPKERTPGPWECKDHPSAPFDGQYRVLGPFFPSHVHGQTFDDRAWVAYCGKYEDACFIAAAPALAAEVEALKHDIDQATQSDAETQAENIALKGEVARLRVATLRYEQLFWLSARDVVFFGTYSDELKDWDDGWHPAVLCNDTFYYAGADAHSFEPENVGKVKDAFDKWGWDGVIALCSIERDEMPLTPLQTPKFHEARAALARAEGDS